MVKRSTLFIAFAAFVANGLYGQSSSINILLEHHFDGDLSPTDTMLVFPSGNDHQWINYDEDALFLNCIQSGETPGGWFWEGDLGSAHPQTATNFAMTSCSWQANPPYEQQSKNWLITPQLFIPDNSYRLSWRSLSNLGPNYVDGYKVLLSTGNNIPEDNSFNHTLFTAAETLDAFGLPYSLDLSDYAFSPGYIHANAYTDTAYFFIDSSFSSDKPFFHGKLEPHSVSLKDFAGQNVYIAFLHDAHDNDKMQLDDIVVSNGSTSTNGLSKEINFQVTPNPAGEFAFFKWQLDDAQSVTLQISDLNGQVLREKSIAQSGVDSYALPLQGLPGGIYYASLRCNQGRANKILIKL